MPACPEKRAKPPIRPIAVAKHILPGQDLSADRQTMNGAGVSRAHVVAAYVVRLRIILVGYRSRTHRESATEWWLPPEAHHVSLCADGIAKHSLIAAPVTENMTIVGQSITVEQIHVPEVLPLRRLVCEIESLPQVGNVMPMDSDALPRR